MGSVVQLAAHINGFTLRAVYANFRDRYYPYKNETSRTRNVLKVRLKTGVSVAYILCLIEFSALKIILNCIDFSRGSLNRMQRGYDLM